MKTIALRFNEKNKMAQKTIEYVLSLGIFTEVEPNSVAKNRTLKAIRDMKKGKDVIHCHSFKEYIDAVSE
ncbi:MAG TPA: hypothetical protein DDY68_02785 [Porphyromonadaceae bacterium]|nr:hypothetical protein [Porphyromonadaceae bacterium]